MNASTIECGADYSSTIIWSLNGAIFRRHNGGTEEPFGGDTNQSGGSMVPYGR